MPAVHEYAMSAPAIEQVCSDRYEQHAAGFSSPSGGRAHNQSLAGRIVLIVEDEALIGFSLEQELEDLGASTIGPVATLSRAIDLAAREIFDGAILDINLNGVDVFPLADILLERDIPFVFHTGHGGRENLSSIYPDVPVCQKPCQPGEVLDCLAEHITRFRASNMS